MAVSVTFPERKVTRAVGRRGKDMDVEQQRHWVPAFAGMTKIQTTSCERLRQHRRQLLQLRQGHILARLRVGFRILALAMQIR